MPGYASAPPAWRRLPRLLAHASEELGGLGRNVLRGDRLVRRGDFADYEETVLLLQGFLQPRNVWEVMEDRLRYDGFGVFSFDLGPWRLAFHHARLDELAGLLAEKVERVCGRYGLQRFHLVAHDSGGLLARRWAERHGGHRRLRSLVTLGSPQRGVPERAAGLWLLGGGLWLGAALESLPLRRRLHRDRFPRGIPFTSIYSLDDPVVPPSLAELRPAPGQELLENAPVRGVGHLALTHDPGVYRLLRARLLDASRYWRRREGREGAGDRGEPSRPSPTAR